MGSATATVDGATVQSLRAPTAAGARASSCFSRARAAGAFVAAPAAGFGPSMARTVPRGSALSASTAAPSGPRPVRVKASSAPSAAATRLAEVERALPGGATLRVAINADGSGKCDNRTTLPFLDHMLDQLGTHGLFDVSVVVEGRGDDATDDDINAAAGSAVGEAYNLAGVTSSLPTPVQFLSPLDESVTDVTVELSGKAHLDYGLVIPTSRVGQYQTRLVQDFFANLVEAAGITLHLRSVDHPGKGNSHHVIEATFKAFARAMRKAIDQLDALQPLGVVAGGVVRTGGLKRGTKETQIDLEVTIDGKGTCDSDSMIPFLDTMLAAVARESGTSLRVKAVGDIHIDDHHTNEDLSIVLGQAMKQALGDCKGINRMGSATATVDGATVQVTLDLSGRPHLGYDLEFEDELIGTYDTQLVEHLYQSFANSSGTTLHVRQLAGGAGSEAVAMAAAVAFGQALRMGTQYDERRMGAIASSKGVLEGFA